MTSPEYCWPKHIEAEWTRTLLIRIMAYRLFGAKLVSMWTNAGLLLTGPLETNFSEIWIKIQPFHSRKSNWKCHLQNDGHFVSSSVCQQGLPYIPRVHLSEGSLVWSPLKWLWSEEPMVRRSFIPKFLYSESYVPKIPYSERPSTMWILCYEDSLVRSSSSPKGLCSELPYFENRPSPIRVLYYEGPLVRSSPSSMIAMFRRFYLPNFARSIRILCYEGSSWWYLNFSVHKILQYWYSVSILL